MVIKVVCNVCQNDVGVIYILLKFYCRGASATDPYPYPNVLTSHHWCELCSLTALGIPNVFLSGHYVNMH